MLTEIRKRDGQIQAYDRGKITAGIGRAMEETKEGSPEDADRVARAVETVLEQEHPGTVPDAEEIQDAAERQLVAFRFRETAGNYKMCRRERTSARESNCPVMKTIDEITNASAAESDLKRENGNVNGDTAMGAMLQIGSAAAKAYAASRLLTPEQARAHREGDIHIHDLDFYASTTTCCQIDLQALLHNGFSTGHGYVREPERIQSAASLTAVAIQANQNDQHGGQSVPNFDYALAEYVRRSYRSNFLDALSTIMEDALDMEALGCAMRSALEEAERGSGEELRMETACPELYDALAEEISGCYPEISAGEIKDRRYITKAVSRAYRRTDNDTYQAMEALMHNLNTMHSRAGSQTPFSSINYGTDTSPEGRMVIRNALMALDAGLGRGEICIFPIHIFKVKDGVNYREGDPNYDLFRLSCKVSARRLFPNYVFLDAPFNLRYYRPGHPETEAAAMGCRTRVMGNAHDRTREISYSRGNLSFTSINLPRLALEAGHDEAAFYAGLDKMLELTTGQLLDRFEIQARKRVRNFPFLMGQGVWLDSGSLGWDDEIREVLKHGTLSIGFIGLAETLTALYGRHHGESAGAQRKGLEIIGHMRDFCDKKSRELGMNFTLLATPAEGLSGTFARLDRKKYGEIPGVTDREYYTNSFHIPVWYPISAYDKIRLEAPYHDLCNAGHITYVELDGDTAKNVEAFESVIRCMHDAGIGYGSVNHPVDRDPVCGYVGVIGDVCPRCGRRENEAIAPEKLEELRKTCPEMPAFLGKV